MMRRLTYMLPILLLGLFISACESLKTTPFDQYSYQKATEIKVESAQLMDEAVNPYEDHQEAVKELLSEIEKIKEYEKNKPYNDISVGMWDILSDKERNLLAGFLKRWETKGQLSEVFVKEAKAQTMEAFDLIIKYEATKDKASKSQLMRLINTY